MADPGPEPVFALHPTLQADCHDLGQRRAVRLLLQRVVRDLFKSYQPLKAFRELIMLHRNASLHWFILVPETHCLDLLDLPDGQRGELLGAAAAVSRYLKDELGYPRVNVGALGLVVPQLHLHVIGRREGDPCWPAPVWGNLPPGPAYSEADVTRLRAGPALA